MRVEFERDEKKRRKKLRKLLKKSRRFTKRVNRVAQQTEKEAAELAGRLFVSEATVKTYVSRLLAKLDLANRTQAAILAHEAGLLEG